MKRIWISSPELVEVFGKPRGNHMMATIRRQVGIDSHNKHVERPRKDIGKGTSFLTHIGYFELNSALEVYESYMNQPSNRNYKIRCEYLEALKLLKEIKCTNH